MRLRFKLLSIEIAAVIGALILGIVWYVDPDGNWEPLFAICGLVGIGAEVWRQIDKRSLRGRFESNEARIRHREGLRKILQEEIYNCRAKKLREDVIIRHVDRVDKYPDIDESEPGISPWFRVGLLDTYKRGIVLGLGYGGLKKCSDGYRFVDRANEEKSDLTVLLMGDVPYDSIVEVNMDGDEYYSYPHIFCYFDFDGQPYERLWFCEKIDQDHGHPYFKHIADYDAVTKNNPDEGPLHFW